jgi:hypothetical protein
MAISGSVKASIGLTNSLDGIDLSTPSETVNEGISKNLATGVVYHEEKDFTTGLLYGIDLGDDSLSDVFGNAISMTTITGVYIEADSDNTVDVVVTAGVDSFFPTLPALGAGEGFSWAGDIDASSNNKLYIQNGAAAGIVKIVIIGTEA